MYHLFDNTYNIVKNSLLYLQYLLLKFSSDEFVHHMSKKL